LILIEEAELYRKQSRYADAEKCLRDALKIFEARFNAEHPDITQTRARLAKVLCEEGKYSQARELATKALSTEEAAYGDTDNLFMSRTKVILGNIYRQDGKYKEAAEMLNKGLTTQRQILGANAPEVAVTMRDLALVQEDEANYDEAESLLQSSLSIIESQTG